QQQREDVSDNIKIDELSATTTEVRLWPTYRRLKTRSVPFVTRTPMSPMPRSSSTRRSAGCIAISRNPPHHPRHRGACPDQSAHRVAGVDLDGQHVPLGREARDQADVTVPRRMMNTSSRNLSADSRRPNGGPFSAPRA